MRIQKGLFTVIFFLSAALVFEHFTAPPVSFAREQEDIVLVGRISHVEGELSRYIPEEQEWVETFRDAPFGLHDALYAGDGARAEFIMPNNTWVRIDQNTHIQMILLTEELTEVDVPLGVARFHNRSSRGVIKGATPFGEARGGPGTIFDLYVGEQSAEILVLKGRVDFFHERDGKLHQVAEEQGSIIADSSRVTSGTRTVAGNWDQWNAERDRHWTRRVEVQGDSARYLPEGLRYDARDLDDHGRWERVYYDGSYHHLWRPTRVHRGWSPYTEGRWITYYGDQCWIPHEPFGYVTHHYGSWVHIGSFWYWAPPVYRSRARVVSPLSITFSWYPGRVGWIHSGMHVGWVPLAPYEVYYSHRYWGPRTVVVNQVNVFRSPIHIHRYRHLDRAVIIRHKDFYRGKDRSYRGARITGVQRSTLTRDYRGAPLLSEKVIPDYRAQRNRYGMSDRAFHGRPHRSVEERIRRNQHMVRDRSGREPLRSSRIERSATRGPIHSGDFRQGVATPRTAGRDSESELVRRPPHRQRSPSHLEGRVVDQRSVATARDRQMQHGTQESSIPRDRATPRVHERSRDRNFSERSAARPTAPSMENSLQRNSRETTRSGGTVTQPRFQGERRDRAVAQQREVSPSRTRQPSHHRLQETHRDERSHDPRSFRSSRQSSAMGREGAPAFRERQTAQQLRPAREERAREQFQSRQNRPSGRAAESTQSRNFRNNPLRSQETVQEGNTLESQNMPGSRVDQGARSRLREPGLRPEVPGAQRNPSHLGPGGLDTQSSRDSVRGRGERFENRGSRTPSDRMSSQRMNWSRESGVSRPRGHQSRSGTGRGP